MSNEETGVAQDELKELVAEWRYFARLEGQISDYGMGRKDAYQDAATDLEELIDDEQ